MIIGCIHQLLLLPLYLMVGHLEFLLELGHSIQFLFHHLLFPCLCF